MKLGILSCAPTAYSTLRLKEAAAQLERCGFGLTSVLLEESERGEKLSDAFRRMRARDALRSALARTQTTGSDQESIQAP